MNHTPQDLRTQTLELINAAGKAGKAAAPVVQLVQAWLDSLDAEDLADIAPDSLAPVLVDGFTQAAKRTGSGCQIATLRYADGRGGMASALLILNEDMPYLVDSIVMAMRRQHLAVRGVMNTVLPVRRALDGSVEAVRQPGDPLESYVLVLLDEELAPEALAALVAALDMVARDAAVVRRDAASMSERLAAVATAAAQHGEEGAEVAAFLEWARSGGFEVFGYAYYRVKPGVRELERDVPSRVGVLQDTAHPVYSTCLANIPGDFDTLAKRDSALSIVKADVAGTLHRDQQLDFIGVRDMEAQGAILGEHCFVGLFTRAGNSTPLAALPFARGRVAKVLSLAGVRQQGFRAEKFRE
ncbi:MAG: NAD-glutamate dehydrogenase, partial [Janthinobacterium sp.]